jgi:DNA recombination protein RmuC
MLHFTNELAATIFCSGAFLGFILTWLYFLKNKVNQRQYDLLLFTKEALEVKFLELKEESEGLKKTLTDLNDKLQSEKQQVIKLETEKTATQERIFQQKADLLNMEEKFRLHFENLANKIFDAKSEKFKKEAEEGLENMLNPLKVKFQEFNKLVTEAFGTQMKEQYSLKNEIERIILANEKITLQAENLTKALKGESKTQGNWGEMILEKILEDSGLRKDQDYTLQAANMALKHPEGGMIRPDVIVKLPDDKHIIIDAKVTLTDYERYCTEPEEMRAQPLRQFLASIRRHVNELESKRYQDAEKLATPDFVLMFIPIEGAYALALQQDATLHNYAWRKRIVIVCPATLFATLRTIASIWRLELQNKNTLEIARRGGELYDKVAAFVEDMSKLGKQLETAKNTYSDTMKKLSEGKGNILKQTENLKRLGVKASKNIPLELLENNEEEKVLT